MQIWQGGSPAITLTSEARTAVNAGMTIAVATPEGSVATAVTIV